MRIKTGLFIVIIFVLFSCPVYSQTDNPQSGEQEGLKTILEKCAEYCEKLSNSALHFVCEETINEELNHGNSGGDRVATMSGGNMTMRSIAGGQNIEKNGLRFPSKTVCREVYSSRMRRIRLSLSETAIEYDNYIFFLVDVQIKY